MKKIYLAPILLIPLGFFFYFKKAPNEIVHPKIGPITESVYAISTVKSEWYYSLRLGVMSSVTKYYVKEGDSVNPGDPLLQVEEGRALFRAPHQGIVTDKPYGIKESVSANTPLLKIVDLKNIYLEASIEQMGALKVAKGMRVIISFEDFRFKNFEGVVRSVLPRDQDFLIQVDSKNLPANILPGMSADLSIEIGTKAKAQLIPTKAISNGFIILKKDNKPQKIKVEIGISDVENSEIITPVLNAEDEIIMPAIEKS